jgi:hypothetical protein
LSDLLRFLFLIPLGYILAVIAAGLTIVFGWTGFDVDPGYAPFLIGPSVAVIAYAGGAAFLPAVAAILAGEMFRWRWVLFYVAVGGAIGYCAHEFGGFTGTPEEFAERRLLFPAAGFVGGFVYWLIAGRLAGGEAPPTSPV